MPDGNPSKDFAGAAGKNGDAPENGKKSNDKPWLKNYPVDVDWHAELDIKSMPEMFDDAVKQFGDNTFMNFMGNKYTYKETAKLIDKAARGFQDMGVKKGTKVGLCLPNTPFYIIAYYGALKAGATVVNFNPLYAEDEIKHQVEDSGAEIMVTTNLDLMYPKVDKMLKETKLKKVVAGDLSDVLPFPKSAAFKALNFFGRPFGKAQTSKVKNDSQHVTFKKMMKNKGNPTPVKIDPENDVAVLQYTGGTTGVPKAAVLTHANLTANTDQTAKWFSNAQPGKEKMLAVLPFFHVFAMTAQLNLSIKTGSELIMLPKFELEDTLKTITKEKPTLFAGVPTIFQAINEHKNLKKYDLSSLKTCVVGGAPLPKTVKDKFEKLSGCTLLEGYGLSETSPLATANPVVGAQKEASIGLPVPQTEVRIMDPDLPGKEQPVNVKGEICLRGPQVMKEYWNKPEETANTIDKDGFVHTGDIGYMDDDGYIFIVDRIKDMIIAGGYNIYPSKVEDAILKHPDVAECIVLGVKDEYRGETVKAFMVMRDGKPELTKDELKEFLSDKISRIEVPKQIEYRSELPKTLIGKPDRKALKLEEAEKAAKAEAKKDAGNDNAPGGNAPPALRVRHRKFGM